MGGKSVTNKLATFRAIVRDDNLRATVFGGCSLGVSRRRPGRVLSLRRSVRGSLGQREREKTAFSGFTFHPDLTSVFFHQAARDGQSEAGALLYAFGSCRGLVELVE